MRPVLLMALWLVLLHPGESPGEGLCSPLSYDPAPTLAALKQQPWELRLLTRAAHSLETCTAGAGGVATPWGALGLGGDWIRIPGMASQGLLAKGWLARGPAWAGTEVNWRSWSEETTAPSRQLWQETAWTVVAGVEQTRWRIGFWRSRGSLPVWGGSLHFPGTGEGDRPHWALGGSAWRAQAFWGWGLDAFLPVGARLSLGWSLEFPPARLGLRLAYAAAGWGTRVATMTDPRGAMSEVLVQRPALRLATLGP